MGRRVVLGGGDNLCGGDFLGGGDILGRWVAARALGVFGVGCAAGSPPGGQVDDEATLRDASWLA